MDILATLSTIGWYVGSYALSIVFGWLTINPLIVRLYANYLPQAEFKQHLGFLTRMEAGVEQVIYITAYLIGRYEIIAGWLIFKTAGEWRVGDNIAEHAMQFRIFIIGSGLSIILSIITGYLIQQFIGPFPSLHP